MKRLFAITILTIYLFLHSVTASFADPYEIDHKCHKPTKPANFLNEWEVKKFKDEVNEYKECISKFVETQKTAIENHKSSAQKAIDEWTNFVKFELKM